MNSLRSHIINAKECFIRYINTSKSDKKTRLRLGFSTHFSGFGYPEETRFLVFDILHHCRRFTLNEPRTAGLLSDLTIVRSKLSRDDH